MHSCPYYPFSRSVPLADTGRAGPDYYGYSYGYGYGNPDFYSTGLSNLSYGLTSPVRSYYGDYYGSGWNTSTLPYWSDDSRFREAADLAYYQQRLAADRSLAESERMARWQQRLEWEALDGDARRMRWLQMAEDQREVREHSPPGHTRLSALCILSDFNRTRPCTNLSIRLLLHIVRPRTQRLGLGLIGSWWGPHYASYGYGATLPYELPSSLRSVYSPYLSSDGLLSGGSTYFDSNYTRYNDLLAWSNALRYDRSLQEAERLQRWRQRLDFEELDEMARRRRWMQMSLRDRATLGLSSGYWDSRYGVPTYYDPRALRPMQYPVSSTLARVFKPYQSKSYLAKALQQGVESAVAFADLVAFENALRADRRLREEDKLRRWKVSRDTMHVSPSSPCVCVYVCVCFRREGEQMAG